MEASKPASGLCADCTALAQYLDTVDFGTTCRHVFQWNIEQGLENLPYDSEGDSSETEEDMDTQQYRAITKVI